MVCMPISETLNKIMLLNYFLISLTTAAYWKKEISKHHYKTLLIINNFPFQQSIQVTCILLASSSKQYYNYVYTVSYHRH